jgi:hypothetical protein
MATVNISAPAHARIGNRRFHPGNMLGAENS